MADELSIYLKDLQNANIQENPDPIQDLGVVPGYGMTQPQGQGVWERPPEITDPNHAGDAVIDTFENNKVNITKLMIAGVSVEEIVNITVYNAFTQGKFTPDVAELIKPALAIFLTDMANQADIPFRMFADDYEESEIDDLELFEIMKERNPKMYSDMREEVNKKERMQRKEEKPVQQHPPSPPDNFLEMGEPV